MSEYIWFFIYGDQSIYSVPNLHTQVASSMDEAIHVFEREFNVTYLEKGQDGTYWFRLLDDRFVQYQINERD